MKIRNNYNNDYGVTYYVHSYKKVFEELPAGFDIEYFKKPKNKGQYIMELSHNERAGQPSGNKSRYGR